MKARCWYEHAMPVLALSKRERERFLREIGRLIAVANNVGRDLRKFVKESWFRRPGDAKGDTAFIEAEFYSRTESHFFDSAGRIADEVEKGTATSTVFASWLDTIRTTALEIFDERALAGEADASALKRAVKARNALKAALYRGKPIKELEAIIKEAAE